MLAKLQKELRQKKAQGIEDLALEQDIHVLLLQKRELLKLKADTQSRIDEIKQQVKIQQIYSHFLGYDCQEDVKQIDEELDGMMALIDKQLGVIE